MDPPAPSGYTSTGAFNSADSSSEDTLGGSPIYGQGQRNPADLAADPSRDPILYGKTKEQPKVNWIAAVRNGFKKKVTQISAAGAMNKLEPSGTTPLPPPRFPSKEQGEAVQRGMNMPVGQQLSEGLTNIRHELFGKEEKPTLRKKPRPASHMEGVEIPHELKEHLLAGNVIPHEHPLREKAAEFVTAVWRRNKNKGKAMSAKLLGIPAENIENMPIKPGTAIVKSEHLEKSKNVREQKKKIFGGSKTGPKSPARAKQMKTLKEYAEKRFNTKVRRAKGKESSSGKQIDKPDMTTGFIEHIGNPDSLAHELAHLDLAPENVALKQFQENMDKEWGAANVKHGYKQQSRIASEYEATARENQIRRKLGMPAHAKTRDVRKPEQAMAADRPFLRIARQVMNKKKYLTGGAEVLSPESKKILEARDSSNASYDPKRGWITKPSIHTAINLRGAGGKEEAAKVAQQYFKYKLAKLHGKKKPLGKAEHDPHHVLSSGRYALLTPHRSNATPEQNNDAHNSFMQDLKKLGHDAIPAKGMFNGHSEPSYMVPDISREQAVNLGKKYGQMSVIHSNGGEHEEISTHPSYKAMGKGKGYSAVVNPAHNHTEIALPDGRPFRFSLNFDGEAMHKAEEKYLEHYSTTPGLKEISPTHMGTGAPSQEYKRGLPEVARSYYYVAGTKPESMVMNGAKSKYHVRLPDGHKLYDLAADPEGHVKAAVQENQGAWNSDKILGRIRDAGYHGYKNSKSPLPNVVAMFHPLSVHSEEPVQVS
jgi:hypothetical protein